MQNKLLLTSSLILQKAVIKHYIMRIHSCRTRFHVLFKEALMDNFYEMKDEDELEDMKVLQPLQPGLAELMGFPDIDEAAMIH